MSDCNETAMITLVRDLFEHNGKLRSALHATINSPKGVVPDEAVGLYDPDYYDVARRAATEEFAKLNAELARAEMKASYDE